jgi:hypothetical protein
MRETMKQIMGGAGIRGGGKQPLVLYDVAGPGFFSDYKARPPPTG